MYLNLAVRLPEKSLKRPITERMQANMLTLACFRNGMLESIHATEPAMLLEDPDTFATLVKSIAVRLAGMLAIQDESKLAQGELLALFWSQFIAGSHQLWCSKWVVEPSHSTDDLLMVDIKGERAPLCRASQSGCQVEDRLG